MAGERLPRSFFARPVLEVAPDLLGCTVTHGGVTLRLTEVEAYAGEIDPGSHAFRGPTPRTRVMFGPAGFLYVYFTYGHHWCANLVVGQEGSASAVLLRGGEVVDLVVRAPGTATDAARVRTGPRVGVSGAGGDGSVFPWRFWLDGEPTVSAYRPGVVRRRP